MRLRLQLGLPFFALVLAGLACVGLRRAPPSPTTSPDPYAYHEVEVSRGVYAFIQNKLDPVVSGNVVAVIGSRAVLVFDTGQHPPITRRMIQDLRKLTPLPVRYVVNSHWHQDHWVGNAEFTEAWPQAEVIAHPFTAALIARTRAKTMGAGCEAPLDGAEKPVRDQLASGLGRTGAPLSDSGRAKLTDWLTALEIYRGECREIRYRAPDRTVDSSLTVDLGGREVQLRFLGRGNTAGDIVAWLPDDKVMLTGDVVVYPWPFATQAYITEWGRVLRQIHGFDPAVLVPGHGDVMHDTGYLDQLAALMESISSQGRAAYSPGMTVDTLRSKIDLQAAAERFAHGDAFIRSNFDDMMGDAIDRMWQELSGEWKPEGI
jgi:glyoxylase-like metal-dependent hydrolase (beta-lactamase superfamily II)